MASTPNTAFRAKIAPYAKKAAELLKMDPAVIMAQWLYETGDGSNTGTKFNNLAGVKLTGSSVSEAYAVPESIHAAYPTLDAFVKDYVRVLNLSYYKDVRAIAKPGVNPITAKNAIDASPYAVTNYNESGWINFYNAAVKILGGTPAPTAGSGTTTTQKKTGFPCLCQICPDRPCSLLKNTGGK